MATLNAFRPIACVAALVALAALSVPAFAQQIAGPAPRLPIVPAGPLPRPGLYRADNIEFLVDPAGRTARLRFVGRDEVFYLDSEPASLGGRVLKYDTGKMALAVTGWGGVTLYTARAPNGIPAERTDNLKNLMPPPVGATGVKLLAANLSQRLAANDNLAVGFAANWDALTGKAETRAHTVDTMRNAAYALEDLAANRRIRSVLAARIHVVQILPAAHEGASVHGDTLTVSFVHNGSPRARPSSLAIADTVRKAFALR